MTDSSAPIQVFISYSHDSAEHVQAVRALSDRLVSEGIDCHIDAYTQSPPEGWPRWMHRQIREATFVLVVCSEPYQRRAEGREEPGTGLGANWEGAIISQSLYDSGSWNEKFIPIGRSAADLKFKPVFIATSTHYNFSTDRGYEDLYRHLTKQPRILRPELGTVRKLPPEPHVVAAPPTASAPPKAPSSTRTLALLSSDHSGTEFIPVDSASVGESILLALSPSTDIELAYLNSLRSERGRPLGVAFGAEGHLTDLVSISSTMTDGATKYSLEVAPRTGSYGAGHMEMSTSGYSADDIATLRARRILLDEKLDKAISQKAKLNNMMLEVLVAGMNTPIQVTSSPLPPLFVLRGSDPSDFLVVARLAAVFWLKLSGVVQTIQTLDLAFTPDGRLSVRFFGTRSRVYINQGPSSISVEGTLSLK